MPLREIQGHSDPRTHGVGLPVHLKCRQSGATKGGDGCTHDSE